MYFTGCAGNIAAGKYNDGSKERRAILTRRLYDGIVASEKELDRRPVKKIGWGTTEILPPSNPRFAIDALRAAIGNRDNAVVARSRPAYTLAWLERVRRGVPPIILSALSLDDVRLLHLPAECFIEYQLRAQQAGAGRFVATAAYGDGGPWYIPTREAYPQGGYEVSVAFCDPGVDDALTRGITSLV